MAEVAKYGLDALAHVRKNVKAGEALTEGLLFGLNSDGEAVKADASSGVKAVGVVYNGSTAVWGAAKEFNTTSTLRAGDYVDLVKYAIIDVTEATYTNAQIGNKLYLGEDGAYTLTENSTVGSLNQHVGYVYSRSSVQIDLTKDTVGVTVAPGNFDVNIYSADGAISPAGFALITGGTGISGLTLGAPVEGVYLEIRIDTLTSGSVVVTTGAGITYDGTNNTATFDAAAETLRLGYSSATQWQIIENQGSVALSAV